MTDVLARRKQQEIERLPPAHAREQPFLPLASKTPEDQPFWVWEQPSSGLHDFFFVGFSRLVQQSRTRTGPDSVQ